MEVQFRERDVYDPLRDAIDERLDDGYDCRVEPRVAYDLHYEHGPEDGATVQQFQADLAVFDGSVPRVAIEVKLGGATTHDLLVYDRKARRHKRIYKHLRYGMVVLEADADLTGRYLWHSEALDFFYFGDDGMASADDLDDAEMARLADVLGDQLDDSRAMERVFTEEFRPRVCNRRLEMGGS